jgi:hypothetical protein
MTILASSSAMCYNAALQTMKGGDCTTFDAARTGYWSYQGLLKQVVRLALLWLASHLLVTGLAFDQNFALPAGTAPPPVTTPTSDPGLHDLLQKEIAASKDIKDKSGPAQILETQKMRDAREEFNIFMLKNTQEAFQWQAVSTKIIFVIVLLVVVAGLYLSWKQFDFVHKVPLTQTTSIGQLDKGSGAPQPAGAGAISAVSDINTIEVSTSGVKITSSVVGLVILVISIVFFFLYLQDVYPLQELTFDKPASAIKGVTSK